MEIWLKILLRFGIWLRKYLVALLLIFGFLFSMGNLYVNGSGPVPQLPPRNLEVLRKTVQLHWNQGTREGDIRLQIAMDDATFADPMVDKTVRGKSYTMRDLMPGKIYYWRLVQNDAPSPASFFRTSPNNVAY